MKGASLIRALKEVSVVFEQYADQLSHDVGIRIRQELDNLFEALKNETETHQRVVFEATKGTVTKDEALGASINAILEIIDFTNIGGDTLVNMIAEFMRNRLYIQIPAAKHINMKELARPAHAMTSTAGTGGEGGFGGGAHMAPDFMKKALPTRRRIPPRHDGSDIGVLEQQLLTDNAGIQSVHYHHEDQNVAGQSDAAMNSVNTDSIEPEFHDYGMKSVTADNVPDDLYVERQLREWKLFGADVRGNYSEIVVYAETLEGAKLEAKAKGVIPEGLIEQDTEEFKSTTQNTEVDNETDVPTEPEGEPGVTEMQPQSEGVQYDDDRVLACPECGSRNVRPQVRPWYSGPAWIKCDDCRWEGEQEETMIVKESAQDRPAQPDTAKPTPPPNPAKVSTITDPDYTEGEQPMPGLDADPKQNTGVEAVPRAGHPDDKPGDVNPAQIVKSPQKYEDSAMGKAEELMDLMDDIIEGDIGPVDSPVIMNPEEDGAKRAEKVKDIAKKGTPDKNFDVNKDPNIPGLAATVSEAYIELDVWEDEGFGDFLQDITNRGLAYKKTGLGASGLSPEYRFTGSVNELWRMYKKYFAGGGGDQGDRQEFDDFIVEGEKNTYRQTSDALYNPDKSAVNNALAADIKKQTDLNDPKNVDNIIGAINQHENVEVLESDSIMGKMGVDNLIETSRAVDPSVMLNRGNK